MNKTMKVFSVLVLAGMFLLPPVAALESSNEGQPAAGPSGQQAAQESLHGRLVRPMERTDDAAGMAGVAVAGTELADNFPLMRSSHGGGVGPRAAPDIYPASYAVVSPDSIKSWRFAGIVCLKNSNTQFNVTVNNSGDGDATGAIVTVNFFDLDDVKLAAPSQTGDIPAGGNATFYFQFRPSFCTWFYINITVTVSGDTNTANDFGEAGYFGIAIWGDDCTVNNGWTGDLAANKWHITDTPEGENATQHTAPNCWYHGTDKAVQQDAYDPNQNVAIKSPTLDLRSFGHQYYVMFDYQFHGRLPIADTVDYFEGSISSDNGATWDPRVRVDSPFLGVQGMAQLQDNWLHWVTSVTGGQIPGLDITSSAGKIINWRNLFVSNDVLQDWGFYLDDFLIWGVEIFNDTKIDVVTDLADWQLNEKKDMDAKVTNLRAPQTAPFSCSLNITRMGSPQNQLSGSTTKAVQALGTGQSATVTFTWTPAETGDFVLSFNISGMPDQDMSNNRVVRWVHVSGLNPRILIVDDDPFVGYIDYTSDYMYKRIINVTGATATDYPYANYAVYYTWWMRGDFPDWGGDGPSATLMAKYDAVIWITGSDTTNMTTNGTLTANDQAALTTYLNGGGALWLSSMGVMNDLGLNTFTRNMLHVDSVRNDTLMKPTDETHILPSQMVGVPGSVADGLSFYMGPPELQNWSWDRSDFIRPDANAMGVWYGNTTPTDPWYTAIQYSGTTYRTVFQAFDPAWILFDNDGIVYIKRVLEFLMGGLEMEVAGQVGQAPLKKMVDPGQSAVFTLYINNTGTKDREVDNITADPAPQGWTVTVDPNVQEGSPTTTVPKGETLELTLTVTAPAKALAGERADIGLNVSFKGYFVVKFNRTITEVNTIIKVELSALNLVQNISGAGSASFPFTLRNLGNLGVTADLQKTGEHFEWLQLSVASVLLNPYEEKNLTAMMAVPEGAYRQAGNFTMTTALTARVVYQERSSNSTLNFTTNIRVAQVFGAKIDEVDPTDATPDMSQSKPSVKFTVTVSSAKGNGYDNVTLELKSKSFAPTTSTGGTGPSRSWDGAGWGLSSAGKVIDVSPFMTVGKQVQLTVFVPLTAEAGEFTIEVRATPGSGKLADGDSTTVTVKVTRPDLQFSGTVSFTPKEPEFGGSVKIKVTVKNLGAAKADGIDVAFYDSGSNLIQTETINSLAAGGSQNVEITWSGFAEGENEITVKLDPDNKISEITKDNNEIKETVVGQRSDLQFDGEPVVKVGGLVKTSVKSGSTVQIELTVKNVGAWSLNLTSVRVNLTDDKTGEFLTETISSLPTRSDAKVTFTWVAKKDGTHTFTITVSCDALLSEKDTKNNEVTGTIKVYTPTPPGPAIDPLMLGAIGAVIAIVAIGAVMMMRKKKPAAPATAPVSAPPEQAVTVVAEEAPPPQPGPPVMR